MRAVLSPQRVGASPVLAYQYETASVAGGGWAWNYHVSMLRKKHREDEEEAERRRAAEPANEPTVEIKPIARPQRRIQLADLVPPEQPAQEPDVSFYVERTRRKRERRRRDEERLLLAD